METKKLAICAAVAALIVQGCSKDKEASPEVSEATAGGDAVAEAPATNKNIVETAQEAGQFNTLVQAVQAAGLADTLAGNGPYTVFAPTDEAFASLPEGTLESLLLPENKDKLTKILTFHIVEGNVTSDQVVGLSSAQTLEGGELSIAVDGADVKVGGADVVQADIPCSNGVIHVVNTVLMPAEGGAEAPVEGTEG